jgi:hypothetical protein
MEEKRAVTQEDEAEMMARLQEEIRNLSVGEHIVYMVHSLSTLAAGRLGLTADGGAHRDLEQARLAIDAFKALLNVLEGVRPAGEMAAHRGMLSQLQLAYVAAMGATAGGASAGAEAAESGGPASAAGAGPVPETTVAAAETAAQEADAAEAPKTRAARKPRKPGSGGPSST